jgi:hypothetical protein
VRAVYRAAVLGQLMSAISESPRRTDALLWTVYLLAPSFGAGLVHGIPLRSLDAVALLLIWWLVVVRRRISGGNVVAAAGLATLFVANVIPGEPGVRGRYYADAAAGGATPWDHAHVDQRLDFSNDATELPLRSFDANQAFAAVWDGQWWTGGNGAGHTLYLYAPGASAELVVDGILVASVTPTDGPRTGIAAPTRGWHHVYIHLSSPYAAPRRFSAGEQIDGRQVPFGGVAVRTTRVADWQLTLLRACDKAKTALDVLAIALLAWFVVGATRDLWRRAAPAGFHGAPIAGLFGLAVIVEAWVFASPVAGRLSRVPASDDSLGHRALLQMVRPLFGDDLFGPVFVGRVLEGLTFGIVAVTLGTIAAAVTRRIAASRRTGVSGLLPPGTMRSLEPFATSRLAGGLLVAAVATYGFVIRTRGVSDHFFLMGDQVRDWTIALGPFNSLPLVGAPSNAGGNSFGPVYYWVLWLSRVTIGPLVDNLPHAGGIGLAAAQSIADAVLCVGIRKASGSWMFAVATVLVLASCPFDLALSSVIWNPVLAVTFVKIGIGLLLAWANELTRPRRLIVLAVVWLAVQAHMPALPVAVSIAVYLLFAAHRRGVSVLAAIAEAACVVIVLQVPAMLTSASVQPTRVVGVLQHPQRLRVFEAFRSVSVSMESMAAAPFAIPQTALILICVAGALLRAIGVAAPLPAITVGPLVLTVLLWAIWPEAYDSYLYMTVVPSVILMLAWTTRLLPEPAGRTAAACLLALALLIQKPRIERASTLFRLPEYGTLVRGAETVARRQEPMRRIDAPFAPDAADPEFVFRILGGRIDRQAPVAARISALGEVSYVH